jgi:hypothetical protein
MATPTYPGDRSNEPKSNNYPLRDMTVWNHNAGGIEFINTKDDEMVTIYYLDGSYTRFNKYSTDFLSTKDRRDVIMGEHFTEVGGNVVNVYNKNVEIIQLGDTLHKVGDVDKWQSYQNKIKNKIKTDLHPLKKLFEVRRTKIHNPIDQSSLQQKQGFLATTPSDEINTKTLMNACPLTYIPGIKAPCAHVPPSLVVLCDEIYQQNNASAGWGEFSGWGTGASPSSQDGEWQPETLKNTIEQKRVDVQKQLFDNEKHLGQNKHRDGGTEIKKVSKDLCEVVGLAFNDVESFRIDPKGKLVPCGIKIDPFGNSVYTQYRESSLLEHVGVEDVAGGNYTLTVGNEYDIVVGAGGLNIKTLGTMEVYAPSITITSEQTLLNSRGELSFAAERFNLSAEIISIRPKRVVRSLEDSLGGVPLLPANNKTQTEPEQQLFIDGNINVGLNAIIAGGAHIEGELTVHHITAPMEEQITDGCFEWGPQVNCIIDPINEANCATPLPPKSAVYADIVPGCIIGEVITPFGTFPVISVCAPNSVMVHDHFHYFKNLPLKLIRDNIETGVTVGNKNDSQTLEPHSVVRAIGARNNFATKVLAKPVLHSETQETVVEKFTGNKCEPLSIDNGNWEEANANDTLPSGEGVRTSNYTDEILAAKDTLLKSQLETTYTQLQSQIDNIANN